MSEESSWTEAKTLAANKSCTLRGSRLPGGVLCGDSVQLGEHGLGAGVILLLRLMMESAFLFAIAFAVHSSILPDNVLRNTRRNKCRVSMADGHADPTCGYTGLPVSHQAPLMAGLSLMAYGACEEYTSEDDAPDALGFYGHFVQTENATFCAAGGWTWANFLYWYADLLLILAFIWRLGALERVISRRVDEYRLTAADYACLLRGLERGVPLEQARERLQHDLMGLGVDERQIDHIEFGLLVSDDLAARERVAALRAERDTLAAKAKAGGLTVATLDTRLAEAEEALAGRERQPQLSSGHAFIVLQLEVDRNQLVERLNSTGAIGSARAVIATVAPEPSTVMWTNLELTSEEREDRKRKTTRATVALLGVSSAFLVVIQFAKRTFTTDYALARVLDVPSGGLAPLTSQLLDPSVLIALAAAIVIALTAATVRRTVGAMVDREAHETRGAFEVGLMWKLSGAFFFNNIIMPIAVACAQSLLTGGGVIGQSFYERTGFIVFGVVLMTIQRLTGDLPRALQCVSLFKRYVIAPRASPQRLESLWDPPDMRIVLPYAQLFWMFACAILYSPLAPFFYGLAAVYTGFSFGCLKFGVVYWYKRPPPITTEVGVMFRRMVFMLLPLQLLIKLFVRRAAEPVDFALHSAAQFCIGLIVCAAAYHVMSAGFGSSSQQYEVLSDLDTDGVRYDRVEATKGYPIDVYDNPYRRGARLRERRGFFGEARPPPATSMETLEQNSAVLSSSLPYEELPMPPIEEVFGAA